MELSYLVRGWPGHPLHPPLTAVTIGSYTAAVIAAIIYFAGSGDPEMAKATGFLVHVGLFSTPPVAITGLIDWLHLPKYSPKWKAGLSHLIAMVIGTATFGITFGMMDKAVQKGVIPTRSFAMILVAYAVIAVGGWLGGKLVFVFGCRVLPAEAAGSGEGRAR